MDKIKKRNMTRLRRKKRTRKRIFGTAQKPRVSVHRSLSHIYAQVIDDQKGITLVAASSQSPEIKEDLASGGNVKAAQKVGELLAHKAIEKQIDAVVFDRSGNLYHGRVKALADAAREAGLKF